MDEIESELDWPIELQSLYGYWVNCIYVWETAKSIDFPDLKAPPYIKLDIAFHRLIVAYGLLYVVIEGYRKLNRKDKEIEQLLEESETVEALRRLRNAMFHYQKNPLSEKVMKFI